MSDASDQDPFLAGGYARLSHFRSPAWKDYAQSLEAISSRFRALAWGGGAHGYPWPLDPLNSWSRIWEYPFVAAHLARLRSDASTSAGPHSRPRVLDVGAAVTFFSAYISQQGFDLTNFDYDPAMPAHFQAAFDRVRAGLGLAQPPRYLVGDARATNLPDASFDVVLCVSVLEHIPSWQRAVPEFIRLLRPGGALLLTFDVRYRGNADGLTSDDTASLLGLLNDALQPLTDQDQRTPPDVLHMENSPRRIKGPSGPLGIKALLRPLKRAIKPLPNLCVFGGVWRKRGKAMSQ